MGDAAPPETDVSRLVIRSNRRQAVRMCMAVLIICALLAATGCFVLFFRPGRDIITFRSLGSVALFALVFSAMVIPAFMIFFHFERAKQWTVGADGIDILDPNYGEEHAPWDRIDEVQVREHGVTLVMRPERDYASLDKVSAFQNRSICFVDPAEARALVRLHLSLSGR